MSGKKSGKGPKGSSSAAAMPKKKSQAAKGNMGEKKPKTQGMKSTDAPAVTSDDRFKHMHYDPRFRRLKKQDQKVKVDERFKGMFDDDRFKLNYTVDKYGRKVKKSTADDMQKFYRLDEDDELDGEEEEKEREIAPASDESSDEDNDEPEYDPMRGIGVSDSSDDEDLGPEPDVEWVDDGLESDSDISRGEDTRRFAICNLDWDHMRAVDILAVMQSFKPPTGVVHSVTIYPSEFGKQRMAEEEKYGPRLATGAVGSATTKPTSSAIANDDSEGEEESDVDEPKAEASDSDNGEVEEEEEEDDDDYEDFEDDEVDMPANDGESGVDTEALRRYQRERMKYYYAVVECDSVDTASHIYKECDGEEYMNSGVLMDLRFIPDDMEFEDAPKEVAREVPADYEPRQFVASAMQQSSVKLTWDEDDTDRTAALRRRVKAEDIKDMDYAAYIASDSDSDSDIEDDQVKEKYSELVKSLREQQAAEEPDQEMEISFEPGLEEKAREALKAKAERERKEQMGVWDEYLEKRKAKRKQKRMEAKQAAKGDRLIDDDDVDVDMNDPFFRDADFGPEFEKPGSKDKDTGKAEKKGKKS